MPGVECDAYQDMLLPTALLGLRFLSACVTLRIKRLDSEMQSLSSSSRHWWVFEVDGNWTSVAVVHR